MKNKICIKCGIEKSLDSFTLRKDTGKYRGVCHDCRRKEYRENEKVNKKAKERAKKFYYQNRERELQLSKERYRNNIEKSLYLSAKKRAKEKNIPFNIDVSDIIVPKKCPVFGFDLVIGTKDKQKSPSLDRIIPEKGYVKGNIIVVSLKANTMKSNATIKEIKKLYDFYKDIGTYLDKQKEGL